MFRLALQSREEIVGQLPDHFSVLDVGGVGAPFLRADYVIDLLPYERVCWSQARDKGPVRFNRSTFFQRDICSKKPWPFKDKQFDYVICAHVLEDIRDPIWVLDEICRVGKAGYIEVPSRKYETTYGTEGIAMAGNSHHRWIIDFVDDALRFTSKISWTHLPYVAKKDTPSGDDRFLRLEWDENIKYYENFLMDGDEQCEYLLGKSDPRTMHHFYRKLLGTNYLLAELKYWVRKKPKLRSFINKLRSKLS